MVRPPAEVVVPDEVVRRLLAEQHLDLASLPIGSHSQGWDCLTVRRGAELGVRLPRRAAVGAHGFGEVLDEAP